MKKLVMVIVLGITIFLSGCEINTTPTYTVTFDVDGGTEIKAIKVEQDTPVDEPVSPVKEGFVFKGWYGDSFLITPYDFSKPVSEDITLHAKWNPEKVTVTYNNLGAVLTKEDVFKGSNLDLPPTPTNEGFVFTGWYLEDTFNTEFDFEEAVTEDVVLYAGWREPVVLRMMFLHQSGVIDAELKETLETLLLDQLILEGFDEYDEVNIQIGLYGEVIAANMSNDLVDVGMLYGSEFARFFDEETMDLILTKTFDIPDVSSIDPVWWNENEPHDSSITIDSPFYRGYIVAGPSPKGQELAAIINNGQDLTWDDIKDASLCVRSETSASGYVFPNLWLYQNFGYTIDDMTNVTTTFGYGQSMDMLEFELCDIATFYPMARSDYQLSWDNGESSIWDATDIIGITDEITYEAMVVNKSTVSPALQVALQNAFINLANTVEAQDAYDYMYFGGFVLGDITLYDAWSEAVALFEEEQE